MRIARLAALASETADPDTFTGQARMTRMPGLSDAPEVKAFRVEFEPAARTHWHTHSGPQVLAILSGRCRLQRAGEPVQEIDAGDVACIAAGERHWHGAAADGPMTHLAVNVESTTTWLEAVTDAEYAGEKPMVLLSGGNPQIAKGDGDAPVQAYIAAMPGWKRNVGRRLDDLVVRSVPDVRKAVRWHSPWYGVEDQGWFLSYHVHTRYVRVTFLQGRLLRPVPPGSGKGKDKDKRWFDVHEGELDEEQMASWIRQAAALPGWRGF